MYVISPTVPDHTTNTPGPCQFNFRISRATHTTKPSGINKFNLISILMCLFLQIFKCCDYSIYLIWHVVSYYQYFLHSPTTLKLSNLIQYVILVLAASQADWLSNRICTRAGMSLGLFMCIAISINIHMIRLLCPCNYLPATVVMFYQCCT